MKVILVILFLLLVVVPVNASLRLNELYPSPDKHSTEWIEIINRGEQPVSTVGYIIRDAANNILPLASKQLEAGGFLIATSSSMLNNSGDTLYLINPVGEVVDIATYTATLNSNQSVAWCAEGGWIITTAISREQPNTEACTKPTASPTPYLSPNHPQLPTITSTMPSPTITLTVPTPTISPALSSGVPVISEVMAFPEDGEEWIELYNPYSDPLSLSEFQIDDGENGSRPKVLSGVIQPQSYLVIKLSSRIFNNEGDQVRLLSSKNNVVDEFSYPNGSKGKTWGRVQLVLNTPVCLMTPTPGTKNTGCLVDESSETAMQAPDNNRSGSESEAGSRFQTGQSSQTAGSTNTKKTATGYSNKTPAVLEEYTASFLTPESNYPDIPVSVQLRSSVPPDTRSTTIALTLSLTCSVFSFISILLKINRVYLPL